MNLLIDIGNSSLKWAIGDGDRCNVKGFVDHENGQPSKPFHEIFHNISDISSAWLSNVAGDAIEQTLSGWIKQQGNMALHLAKTEKTHNNGLINGYDQPQSLGVDRWLAMVAAWQTHQTGCCVIDCGTAITLDLIEHTGKHTGGLIFPGLNVMQTTLVKNTKGCTIHAPPISPSNAFLATNTQDAVSNAAAIAAVSFIDATAKKITSMTSKKVTFLLSGGHADMLKPRLSLDCELVPHLVLEGLNIVSNSSI